jgi:hypothetical protein
MMSKIESIVDLFIKKENIQRNCPQQVRVHRYTFK